MNYIKLIPGFDKHPFIESTLFSISQCFNFVSTNDPVLKTRTVQIIKQLILTLFDPKKTIVSQVSLLQEHQSMKNQRRPVSNHQRILANAL